MLLKVNYYSDWVGSRFIRKMIKEAGFIVPKKTCWFFLKREENLLNEKKRDSLPRFARMLKMDEEACYSFIRAELEKVKGLVAVECLDGLYAHPDALGRVLLKAIKKVTS